MAISLSIDDALRLRVRAQRLAERSEGGAEETLRAVLAVQAQELAAARLALRARGRGLTAADVEAARQEQRTIVWTWAMRGTLHLLKAEDAAWVVPLLGQRFAAGDQRRLRQLGWDGDRLAQGEALVERLLARGPQTRAGVAGALAEAVLPSEGQAPVHLLARLALLGRIVRAADGENGQPAYSLWEEWLGPARPLPPEEALARLARGYLAAYAPASAADFAAWAGLPLGEARRALDSIEGELAAVSIAGEAGWMLREQEAWLSEPPERAARLLPRFDAYLLGYAGRSHAVPGAHARKIHPGGGMILAAVLVDGRIAGTWKLERKGKAQKVLVEPFEPLPAWAQPAVEAEAEDIRRFIGREE